MRKLLTCLLLLLWPGFAWAVTFNSPLAYPVQSELVNPNGQAIGTTLAGSPTIPQVGQSQALFAPSIAGPVFRQQGIFGDTTGRILDVVTDGVLPINIAPPFKAASTSNAALVVTQSPNPVYRCPYIAPINTTANANIIVNPGGKRIFVCNVLIINGATAQSVTVAEGTGTTCGTGTVYWLGGSGGTAAIGISQGFAAMDINWPMQVAGDNVCLIISGSTNVSGSMTYGIFN